MQPTDALRLENWIPRVGYLETRGEMVSQGVPLAASLMRGIFDYPVSSGTNAVIAVSFGDGRLYKWNGTVFTHLKSNTVDKPNASLFQDKLILTDGTNTAQVYDGTSMTDLTVTSGPAANTLWGSCVFKGRMYYWQRNVRKFAYAKAGSYQGDLTEFDLSTFTTSGGFLVRMVPLMLDGGQGTDDLACFVFSTGEVLVYQGDDPGNSAAWQQIGRYTVSAPFGYNAFVDVGGSPLMVSRDGIWDLTKAIFASAEDAGLLLPQVAYYQDFSILSARCVYAPKQRLVVIAYYQDANELQDGYMVAMNVETGLWFNISGWQSPGGNKLYSMGVIKGVLYATNDLSQLLKYDEDTDPKCDFIVTPAYTNFGIGGTLKQLTAVGIHSDVSDSSLWTITPAVDFSDVTTVGNTNWNQSATSTVNTSVVRAFRSAGSRAGQFLTSKITLEPTTARQKLYLLELHYRMAGEAH